MAKRILIFNDGLSLGGTEKLLINLLQHLSSTNVVTLLLPEQSNDDALLSDVPKGVSVNYLWTGKESSLSRRKGEMDMIFRTKVFLIDHDIKEEDYDLLICFKEGFYAKIFAEFKIYKLLWVHNILYVRKYQIRSLKDRLSVWLNKKKVEVAEKSYLSYDKIICVSKACKESYIDIVCNGDAPKQEIEIIPNAIDITKIRLLSEEKMSIRLPSDKINFILLTRVSPDKRIDRALAAAERLKNEKENSFHIHIIGVDADDKWLQGEIERREIGDAISVYGKLKNPFPYLVKADWSLCVSERESFSLALLESMSLGVPVITTNCGGPADIVDGGKYGLLVDNSTDGVYFGLKKVLDDKTLEAAYKKKLHEVVERYDYSRWLKSLDSLLIG